MSHNPGSANPTHAIQIDDTDSSSGSSQGEVVHDSDSDGGMQIDQPEPILQIAGTELQLYDHGLDVHELDAHELDAHALDTQVMALREECEFTTHAPNPDSYTVSPRHSGRARNPPTRTRMREEDHAALTVLNDWELLVTYALKSHRTIPQTRRLFMAKLLAETPEAEDELYAARFVVPESKTELMSAVSSSRVAPEYATGYMNQNAYLVPGAWKEVVSHEEGGWWAGAGARARGARQQKRSVSGRSSRDASRDASGVE